MKKLGLTTLSLAAALAVAGCSDPEPVDETITGELSDDDPRVEQDDSPYDQYELEAGQGWTITAEMESSDFDTYLWLIGPDGTDLLQIDDSPGRGTNSALTHTTTRAGTYILRANSYDGTGRGAYTLHYTAEPAGSAESAE
jgi:serine protease Do